MANFEDKGRATELSRLSHAACYSITQATPPLPTQPKGSDPVRVPKSDEIASLKHVKRPPWRIGNPPKQFKSAFVVQCPAYLPRFHVCSFVA